MYKIGIDARLYGKTGVGVYLKNLLYYLGKLPTGDMRFYIYLLPDSFDSIPFGNKKFIKRKVTSKWHSLPEQLFFPFDLYRDNLDLMHFTYFSYPILYKRPFVATVHDVTPLFFKTGKASSKNPVFYQMKYIAYQKVIKTQIENAKTIITPSNFVKDQIIKHYGEKFRNKIVPIYEGVDHELSMINDQLSIYPKNFQTHKKFFIYVGNFYPHKNVEKLVRAFVQVKEDVRLILIGPDDFFSHRLVRLIDQLGMRDRILFYHNPDKGELAYFYTHAMALIHPSLSEGFGLTLLEAAHFKLPIIASNIEIFQEILGGKFTSFDPHNTNDITKAIDAFITEKKNIDASSLVKEYSFEQMASKTLEIYRQNLRFLT